MTRTGLASVTLVVALALGGGALGGAAVAAESVYTVGNYPVDARAVNAVEAKKQAIADGQNAALRSLIKRLVPVTRYAQLQHIELPPAAELVDSVQVRSERNSRTEYVAVLDIAFRADAVRSLLRAKAIAFVEKPAQPTTVVLVYEEPVTVGTGAPAEIRPERGAALWTEVWSGLDLKNGLAPVTLAEMKPQIHPDTLAMVLKGDSNGNRILAGEYGTPAVVVAAVQADLSTRRLNLKFAGVDAVGAFAITRTLRFEVGDFAYAMELAAVVAQGVLEGRWKAVTGERGGPVSMAAPGFGPAAAGSADGPVRLRVQFVSLAQWQEIRKVIEQSPGVSSLAVEGLSARAADIAVGYPGGGAGLAQVLARSGLSMEPAGEGWVIR